jgi:hypothetical protein
MAIPTTAKLYMMTNMGTRKLRMSREASRREDKRKLNPRVGNRKCRLRRKKQDRTMITILNTAFHITVEYLHITLQLD